MSEQRRSPDEKLDELARAIESLDAKIRVEAQAPPQSERPARKPRGIFERIVFWLVIAWSMLIGLLFLFLPAPGVPLWEKLLSAALTVAVGLPMAMVFGWQAGRTATWFSGALNKGAVEK